MPVFEYRATNADGKPVSGTVLSGSLSSAADQLAKDGLQVTHLGAASGIGDPLMDQTEPISGGFQSSGGPNWQHQPPPTEARAKIMTDVVGPVVNRVALSQLLFFFRQLATMLKAGVPIVQTLDTLSTQASDPRLKSVIRELKGHALEGRPISTGLQRYPEMFSPLVLSLIRVGERGGFLDRSCEMVANYMDKEIEIRNLVRRVTIYPKLVLAASIVIILGTNAIIASLGKSGGLSSPLTQLSTWMVLGPLLVGAFLYFRVGLQNPRINYMHQQVILAIPYFGTTVRQLAMAKFGRAFGALYSGGVAVQEAVKLSADACGNEVMRSRLHPVAAQLEEGGSITRAFTSAGVFSPIVLDMVHTGETTGNVDQMLERMADFYEDEARVRSIQSGYALGVVALLAVAVYVGYVVVNFYTGYFGGISRAVEGT